MLKFNVCRLSVQLPLYIRLQAMYLHARVKRLEFQAHYLQPLYLEPQALSNFVFSIEVAIALYLEHQTPHIRL